MCHSFACVGFVNISIQSEHWQRFQLAMPAMLRHLGELLQHVREFPLEAEPATEEMKKPAAVKSGQEDEF